MAWAGGLYPNSDLPFGSTHLQLRYGLGCDFPQSVCRLVLVLHLPMFSNTRVWYHLDFEFFFGSGKDHDAAYVK